MYVSGGRADKVYALRATTGHVLWDSGSTVADRVVAEPIVMDGHVYAAAYDGNLYAWGL